MHPLRAGCSSLQVGKCHVLDCMPSQVVQSLCHNLLVRCPWKLYNLLPSMHPSGRHQTHHSVVHPESSQPLSAVSCRDAGSQPEQPQ